MLIGLWLTLGVLSAGASSALAPEKICITTYYSPRIANYAQFAAENHARYAQRHRYRYWAFSAAFALPTCPGSWSERRSAYWQKLGAVEQLLQARDVQQLPVCQWVMWIDADAVFTNPATRLEDVLQSFTTPGVTDVLLTGDKFSGNNSWINSGVFFISNSEGGRAFMDNALALCGAYHSQRFPEQHALSDLAFGHVLTTAQPPAGKLRDNIAFAPYPLLQAFAADWRPCAFILHSAGERRAVRAQLLQGHNASDNGCSAIEHWPSAESLPDYVAKLHEPTIKLWWHWLLRKAQGLLLWLRATFGSVE